MKVICEYSCSNDLKEYEYEALDANQFGRFGITKNNSYPLKVGKEYLVMGIIIFEKYTSFLVDDGVVLTAPCYLFEVIDNRLDANWRFRFTESNEEIYPYIQAIFGYEELCTDKNAYENLVVDMTEEAALIYFKRKLEAEQVDIDL